MARGTDTRVWIMAACAVAVCTVFLLSYSGGDDDNTPRGGQYNKGGISIKGRNQYKIPMYNREGLAVTARFDVDMTHISELNITTTYYHKGREKQMELFVMGTSTNPPFAAVIASPPMSEAASSDVYQNGDMEKPTRRMFEFLLNKKCSEGNHLVVDAGANLGYFATYAGVMGCRVEAFEPQPRLIPMINTSIMVNSLTERFTLHNNIINTDKTARLKITYAGGSCTGCSVVTPAGPNEEDTESSYIITATRIDDYVKDNVLLMKVDVEGYEVLAIESAKGVFDKYTVKNILVEWFPARFPHGVERGTKLLEDLVDQGYKLRHYDLRFNLPTDWVVHERIHELTGSTWLVPRNRIKDMNEHLMTQSYGEANLWLSKEY